MQATKSTRIKRVGTGDAVYDADCIVIEMPLVIRINGHRHATLMCTPLAIDYLVIGYLLSDGIIDTTADLISLDINDADGIAEVAVAAYDPVAMGQKAVTSGCGKGEIYLEMLQHCRRNTSVVTLSSTTLLQHVNKFNKMSALFLSTGGVHSGAICSPEDVIIFQEDIGRHNAVDKLIGEAASCGIGLSDKILLTSGRLSSEILLKAARQGIPIIVSRSAPTSLAVEIAERLNITLVGFARGNRMNIYAGESRIDG